ncbi:MAG: 50S ribosomal protein L15 [Deltaproteobacteria bacterium]|nr:50S ribosomal protein L15 [Deltaproteobacteria bacterium]
MNRLRPRVARKGPKRLGRGESSGHGKPAGRGNKGQGARAGGFHKRGFEGGQTPLARRLPKRGFTNIFRKRVGVVNLDQLAGLPAGTEVTLALAKERGWISNRADFLKILGVGEVKTSLTFKSCGFSKTAKEKIEKSGGAIH